MNRAWSLLLKLPLEQLLQRLSQIIEKMSTVRYLHSCRRTLSDRAGIGFRTISGDDLYSWVCFEPSAQRLRFTIRQQINRSLLFFVHQQRAVTLTAPKRKIIHTRYVHSTNQPIRNSTNAA